ncbi:MAG: class I SAM-dependent methyltransferase [Candidatus Omnitrophica bacterium]|nr:class I SAM-dependent methyltransferase [Candidatus Omnitrophota bacterium]
MIEANAQRCAGYFSPTTIPELEGGNKIYTKFPFLKKPFEKLRDLPPSPRILDIGCGRGQVLKRCKMIRHDAIVVGVDISNDLYFIKEPECSFLQVNLEEGRIPLEDNSFDLITCEHVVEHLNNFNGIFLEIRRLLRSDGIAYIEAPDLRTTWLPQAPFAKCGGINFYDDPTHIRPFTQGAFRLLAIRSGFSEFKTFQVRNWAWFLAGPYLLWRYIQSRDATHLHCAINPYLGNFVGCYLKK